MKGSLKDLILPFGETRLEIIIPENIASYKMLAREDIDNNVYLYLQGLIHIHICVTGLVTSSVICTE